MKTYKDYREILSKHQNLEMLTTIQIDNICQAMQDLEKETASVKKIGCNCSEKDKHGETKIFCCNNCGLPTVQWWSN